MERVRLYRWTRRRYDRLIDRGVLDEDEPVELLDGLLLVKEPRASPHRTSLLLAAKALELAFGAGWFVRPGPARPRWGYASITALGAEERVSPLAAPDAFVRVADLLP